MTLNLLIDYGFALNPIRKGYLGEKFENIMWMMKFSLRIISIVNFLP